MYLQHEQLKYCLSVGHLSCFFDDDDDDDDIGCVDEITAVLHLIE